MCVVFEAGSQSIVIAVAFYKITIANNYLLVYHAFCNLFLWQFHCTAIFNCREETETQQTADEESLEMTYFEYTTEPLDELTSAKLQIDALTGELQTSKSECESLQQQLNLRRFGVRRFSNDNNLINFYTGFPNYKLFLAFYECI